MRGLAILLAGVMLVVATWQDDVSAQDRRLPPEEVSEETWQAFVEATGDDVETRRRAHFRRADFEPVLDEWSEELGEVLVPEWKYALRDREIVTDEYRWTIERKSYNTMVGEFDLYVLHQSGGGQFRQTFAVPQNKLDEADFEYADSVRQGTPFDARVEEFAEQLGTADAALAQLCELAGSDFSMPAGSRVKGSGGVDRDHTRFKFRDRTIRECIWKIAQSVGWRALITDAEDSLQPAVTFEHLDKWFESNDGGDNESGTWRGAMKNLLKLKLVEIETEDLFVSVRPD